MAETIKYMNKNKNKVSTAQLAKMSRQWQWLQNARNNSTVSGSLYVRP